MAERPPCKRQVSGSIPLTGSDKLPASALLPAETQQERDDRDAGAARRFKAPTKSPPLTPGGAVRPAMRAEEGGRWRAVWNEGGEAAAVRGGERGETGRQAGEGGRAAGRRRPEHEAARCRDLIAYYQEPGASGPARSGLAASTRRRSRACPSSCARPPSTAIAEHIAALLADAVQAAQGLGV